MTDSNESSPVLIAVGAKKQQPISDVPKKSLFEARDLVLNIKRFSGEKAISRLKLAQDMNTTPSSSQFRMLISAANRYGLVEGSYSSPSLSMTALGESIAFQVTNEQEVDALRSAFLSIPIFKKLVSEFNGKRIPTNEQFHNHLKTKYEVPLNEGAFVEKTFFEAGLKLGLMREMKGGNFYVESVASKDVVITSDSHETVSEEVGEYSLNGNTSTSISFVSQAPAQAPLAVGIPKNAFFIGHGKNKKPLKQVKEFLNKYHIPFKVDEDEPNKGRPISKKVKDMFDECGAAILIFSADEEFRDLEGNPVFRPSESVIHELGVSSYLYGTKIIIFKEDKVKLPSNFNDLGYIEFSEGDIESKIGGLLQELIGMNVIKISLAS